MPFRAPPGEEDMNGHASAFRPQLILIFVSVALTLAIGAVCTHPAWLTRHLVLGSS